LTDQGAQQTGHDIINISLAVTFNNIRLSFVISCFDEVRTLKRRISFLAFSLLDA